ncbi:MAG: hypothetical protein M1821_002797 [Bathelium mastoideum]|nr:MAG: hypothetical protein M1821_002797 [Bathelium mastoideum]KAI9694563.1 MAG: hypothetical protein M1822_000179 [Bathelium mastoideum]
MDGLFRRKPLALLLASLFALTPLSLAERVIESESLNPCQADSRFSATLFNVAFTPNNNSLSFNINGVSDISGNVTAELLFIVYGYNAYHQTINPCTSTELSGLCPMNEGQIQIQSANTQIDASVVKNIPGIAYTVPDLDAKIQIYINMTDSGESVACVEAELSNGKTVYQKAVSWTTAVIAGIALITSAVTSGLGHSNTAAHVAANALSLFGYFQAQAFIGMSAVPLPPIVQSWTQNFQWSMGIIRVGFLQDLALWYQRSTGGTPSQILSELSTVSVEVEKRSLEVTERLARRGAGALMPKALNAAGNLVRRGAEVLLPRTNSQAPIQVGGSAVLVKGIDRVGFRAGIELTNIFLTGYIFFVIFIIFTLLGLFIFKGVCVLLARAGKIKVDTFQDFRNGWTTVVKGILYRIILIGFPQMVVLCFWELTVRDSSAEVVLAVFTIFAMIAILGWASSKVIRIAQRSITMHQNPAYILYSDPVSLNKWGFLYVQFKATAYYFIVPLLVYILIKGMFIGLSQSSGTVQAIALVLLEAAILIAVSILRPYMDKKVNAFNIAIAAANFISAIFLLIFSDVFNQPGIVTGVIGVVFFIFNAAFATVLLVLVLVSSIYAIASKNPDTRYQPMRDDRGSFIKSQTQLGNTELDALGATARGDKAGYYGKPRLEDDDESFSSQSDRPKAEGGPYAPPPTTYGNAPRSPINASVPMFPGNGGSRHGPPSYGGDRTESLRSDASRYRNQNNTSPWQRGAGYDH